MSSPKVIPEDRLPPGLPSMWRLFKLGYRHEPGLMGAALGLELLAALPESLVALWFMLLGMALLAHNLVLLVIVGVALAVSAIGTWLIRTVSTRIGRRYRDKITIVLEGHVAQLQASVSTIAHQERPEYLDRLAVLRNQVFVLDHMYQSVFGTLGWLLRLTVTIVLVASIHPLLILLAVLALPAVFTSSWRPDVERRAQERGAQAQRLGRHLFAVATSPAAGKEVRVAGIGPSLARNQQAAWARWNSLMLGARWGSALWHSLGWAIFGLGYAGAVVFVAAWLRAPSASVLLVLAAGSRLSAYIAATVSEVGFMRGMWLDGARRLAWLEDYAAAHAARATEPAPAQLRDGIRFDHVSFAYPGSNRLVLDEVSFELPKGSVVAVVGENGAGKSTLIKLLAKMYEPVSGVIYVDDVPLSRINADTWREKLAGAFQDFFRFELRARESVGLGDVPQLENEPAVALAVSRAGAEDVVGRLPSGLNAQLGPAWAEGVDLSFGQWQKLALARGFMRDGPLVLVLDEPTAALDAETEHTLFERFAAAARGSGSAVPGRDPGRITLLVSHRFSTVRMADLIVVLDGSKVVEVGSHTELLAKGGQYASLYAIQAKAYR